MRAIDHRTGIGFDSHALGPLGRLVLGGVEVPHDRGIAGHGKGGRLVHATLEAVLRGGVSRLWQPVLARADL